MSILVPLALVVAAVAIAVGMDYYEWRRRRLPLLVGEREPRAAIRSGRTPRRPGPSNAGPSRSLEQVLYLRAREKMTR